MIEIKHPRDLQRLRRKALNAQGLSQSSPFGRGLTGARNAIHHLGYVQIDTISVVERAHHHVLRSRVPAYKPEMLDALLQQRDIFEYWSHAAAFLPIADFRFSLPYKQAISNGQIHWYKTPDRKLMREVLARVRADGPLRSRDLEAAPNKRAGWWDWKPAKKALEQLYMQGDLMVSSREGFEKAYDLTERVLPDGVDSRLPSTEEFAEHLLHQQLCCHGLVSLKGLTYLRRDTALRNAVKTQVNDKLADGELESVQLPDGQLFFIKAGSLDQPLKRSHNRLQILSPFDNSVIQRDRLKALFNFDYQIECYVPAAKRRYGYFCLPLLYRDEFVGRMDCKAHRKEGLLEIKSLYLEEHTSHSELLLDALVKAIEQFRDAQGCHAVKLVKTAPASFAAPLRRAL